MIRRLALLALLLAAPRISAAAASPLILISLDGFRWDYGEKYAAEAATLRTLRREGVAARGLIPVFPSNTFPNHYTLVTGLYPAQHGIINNEFFDSELGTYFRYYQPASVQNGRWWGGEPIWVTAIRQGRKAGVSYWTGSEAEIAGTRPTYWKPYDYRIPFAQRLEEMVGWLARPEAERPAVIAFYFEETNSAGHRFGPDSPETAAAVKLLDGQVATLLARVRGLGLEPNLVIVSDHGMTATSLARTVALDDYVDLQTVQIDTDGSVVTLRPRTGSAVDLVRTLEKVPHARACLAEDLPAHLRLQRGPRVAPVWLLPEEGWHVGTRASIERLRLRFPEKGYLAGDHGYDPQLPNMRGILIAHGPAFRRGVELPELESVHVYALLCAVLKLTPARHDGDDRLVRAALPE